GRGPPARVLCFPHAGGNPRAFLAWQGALAGDAELLALCPPGRGPRYQEPPAADFTELVERAAEAVAEAADRPCYLFGHSFGAVVAFEVARRLRGHHRLRHLIASGCSAPALLPTARVVEAARLEGRAFTEAVGFFGGLPPEVVADEALAELLLPALRADFRIVARYRYRDTGPLDLPITLINGRDDPHVKEAGLEPWQRESTLAVARHQPAGGHFYFEDHPEAATDVIRSVVRSDRGAPPPGAGPDTGGTHRPPAEVVEVI
ncbi:thioesterase II family protein, partial [Streptomyces sp. URMC 123]|uniref:thioesterase II family protein n=1 Tax=Streptomyces sp. URMC 123 TaxID=3423403 RepID=UPI003F1C5F35